MLDPRLLAPERIRPYRLLQRRQYERLVENGVFDEDDRIELLRGQLVEMSPQGEPHATLTARLQQLFARRLDETYEVRAHSPFAATDDSEPEPDVSVSRARRKRFYHPSKALLLVEVAESSVRKDRQIKAAIYAENGAPEYWIVDVRGRCVYVYSHPRDGEYTVVRRVERRGTLRPMYLDISVNVSWLFSGR